MPDWIRACGAGLFKKAVVVEAGAAIIFFGSLIHRPELPPNGAAALRELQTRGYQTPTVAEPVRVYPAQTGASFNAAHAGGWRPGVISLREAPPGTFGPGVYLRHELMHEASFRTCGGRLALWAEEAAAIAFSGELPAQPASGPPAGPAVEHLRERVRIGADLDARSYGTLSALVASFGWPDKPCAVQEEIDRQLRNDPAGTGFSYILISMHSGRTLEAKGNLDTRYPPGSLLKIPYAASLGEAAPEIIGRELATSDTGKLLARKGSFVPDRFRFLTSLAGDAPLNQQVAPPNGLADDDQYWRRYLGERSGDGNYPFEANLGELALILRASLLLAPERFSGLSANGTLPGSTLINESEHNRGILKGLHAMAKTGTASDPRGTPLVGHLMVAWPQQDPQYLAVFRSIGSNGASNLRAAATLLQQWSANSAATSGQVRVRIMALLDRTSWEIVDECPSREQEEPGGGKLRFSTCGRFKILSAARGSRTERYVWGVLQTSPDGDKVVLKTDPLTYADAVLSSEAEDLQGAAKEALRAVIVWNGLHGGNRHPDTSSLCDSTHCMVFQGQHTDKTSRPRAMAGTAVLQTLDQLTKDRGLDWLPFSEGGAEQWERRITGGELQRLTGEAAILDLRRERRKNGEIVIHLMYPDTEEKVPCEVFRSTFKLPSCPESIHPEGSNTSWHLAGIGRGHGQGLSVDRARTLGKSGASAPEILQDAYR